MSSPDLFLVNLQDPGTEEHARVERMFAALRDPSAEARSRVQAELAASAVRSILPRGDSWEPPEPFQPKNHSVAITAPIGSEAAKILERIAETDAKFGARIVEEMNTELFHGEGVTEEELQEQRERNREAAAYVDSLDPDAPPPEV